MAQSAELTRFLADHATAERRTAFLKDIRTAATTADVAAVLNAKGYRIDDTEVAAALGSGNQGALTDVQLEGVVGGNSLPLLDMLRGSPPPPGTPLADTMQPALMVLVNLGYH